MIDSDKTHDEKIKYKNAHETEMLMNAYSCDGIVHGWPESMAEQNLVRRKISYTSELRLC